MIDIIDSDSESSRIGIYDPSYWYTVCGAHQTPHAVVRAWPRAPTCAPRLCSFQSCSTNTARSPSWCCRRPRVRWRAAGRYNSLRHASAALATCTALAACTALATPPWVRFHPTCTQGHPLGAVAFSRKDVLLPPICAALTSPLRRGSALPPTEHTPPRHVPHPLRPLRRGSVLLLGVEDHLKIEVTQLLLLGVEDHLKITVTQAFTSRPSPRTPFGPRCNPRW